MKKEYFFITVFLAVVALSFYLFYRLLLPTILPICWAAIFVVVFRPLYRKLEKPIPSANLRALALTALIVILIVGPITYLAVSLVQEAIGIFEKFQAWIDAGKLDQLLAFKSSPIYSVIEKRLSPYIDISKLDLRVIIENGLQKISVLALSQATNALTNAGKLMFQFSLVILFSFFLFRDGEKLMEQIKAVIPMTPDKADLTINHLRAIVESTMYGGVVVALTQGLLGGLLFLIMGLPSPVFWGAVMTFLAFLPILGPFLIYIPAGIILILNGAYVKGVIILIIGTVVVSQVDNFLRPMLVSGKTGMHTMLMFISMIGGASLFGLLGVVLGPFIAAIFVSIFDIFRLKLIENGAPPEPATSPPTPRLGPDDEEPIDL